MRRMKILTNIGLVIAALVISTAPIGIKAQNNINKVRSISWSEDGHKIAYSRDDGIIQIQNTITDQIILSIQGDSSGPTTSVAFGRAENANKLASAGADGIVKIWDSETGDLLLSFTGYDTYVSTVNWNPINPNLLASVDILGLIKIWDIQTSYLIFSGGKAEFAFGLKWSPDGKQLVTTNGIAIVLVVLDSLNGVYFSTILPANMKDVSEIITVDWDPNQDIILSGTIVGNLTTWNVKQRHEVQTFNNGVAAINSAVFSPDSMKIASVSYDKALKIWDVATGNLIYTLSTHSIAFDVSWSPDGTKIAYGGEGTTFQIVTLSDLFTPPTETPP